ncbi:MAG: glycosyltransferase family 4 protein [Actinomycetota bacterium]|nr:glycosyltransferase family 4 protein [Actinomycetota bacterium]
MRLAVVESAPRGGLLHYAAQLAEALAARGHDVDLITARGHELPAPLERARVRAVLRAAVSRPSEPPTGGRYLLRRAGIALRVLAASSRTLWEIAFGRYDAALLVDDLSVTPAAAGALALTLLPQRPLIAAVCHEPRPRSRRPGADLYATSRPLLAVLAHVYARLDLVLVHGERSREVFKRTWRRAGAVATIPHGDERLLAETPPPPAAEERVLFFGEWRRAKGLWELMAAFDELAGVRPQIRLTIAGTPTADVDPDGVRRWAHRHRGRVTIIDEYVPLEQVREVFTSARVVAAPYLAGSQSGVVHLAMTMARAVVASDVGDLGSAVLDGETGRLVPPGDARALAVALEEVVADRRLAERLGTAGRRHALETSSWETVAERVEAELDRLPRTPGRAG